MSSVLETIQEDFYGRALASAAFADTAVILQRKALTEAEVNKQLSTLKGRSGKVGTCLLVQMPELRVVDPNLPGPQLAIAVSVVVIEHPTFNAGTQGSGVTAEELALDALQLFHHFRPYGVTQVFVGTAAVPDDSLAGLVAYTVTFTSTVAVSPATKVATPTIAVAGTVTLSCLTSGAAVYYTVDGSYPSAANTTAALYASPFTAPAAGTILRAAAGKSGLQQSDVAQLTF